MDTARLDKILEDFYLISGMETSVLDADFHSIAVCRPSYENFCSVFHRFSGTLDVCKSSDIEHLSFVRSNLKPTLYTCPCGIVEAIVPIIRGDSIAAYVISSIGICTDDRLSAQIESSLEELERLLETAGGTCFAKVVQNKDKPDPRTLIGSGKVREICELCEANGIELVVSFLGYRRRARIARYL